MPYRCRIPEPEPPEPPVPGTLGGTGLSVNGGYFTDISNYFSPTYYECFVESCRCDWLLLSGSEYGEDAQRAVIRGLTADMTLQLDDVGTNVAFVLEAAEAGRIAAIVWDVGEYFGDYAHAIDLSGNKLNQAGVDGLLENAAYVGEVSNSPTMDLSGGANAEPSEGEGGGWYYYDFAVASGWSISVNGEHPQEPE